MLAETITNLVDQKHVCVVVLLKELEVEALIDRAFKDSEQLDKFSVINQVCIDGGDIAGLDDRLDELLALLLDDIEGDLVSDEVLVILRRCEHLHEELGGQIRPVQMELALSDLVVIMIVAVLLALINFHDDIEDSFSEVLRLDGLGGEREGVAEHVIRVA